MIAKLKLKNDYNSIQKKTFFHLIWKFTPYWDYKDENDYIGSKRLILMPVNLFDLKCVLYKLIIINWY